MRYNPSEEFDSEAVIAESQAILARWSAWWVDNPHATPPSFAVYFTGDGEQHTVPIVQSSAKQDILSQLVRKGSNFDSVVAVLYVSSAPPNHNLSLAGSLNLPNRALTFYVRPHDLVQTIEDTLAPGNLSVPQPNPGPPTRRKRYFQEPWEMEPREVMAREALIPGAGYVEAGIAHVIERLNELGLPPMQSSSGLSVDAEGSKPGGGYIAWLQSDLTQDQIAVLRSAAEAARLSFKLGGMLLFQPDVTVRTEMTRAGVSVETLRKRALAQAKEAFGADYNDYGETFRTLWDELIAEHGGRLDDNDLWIQDAWRRFLEAVEAQVAQLGQGVVGGDPYSYAFLLVHNNPTQLRLKHGTLHPPNVAPFKHAWAESDDRVFDWSLAYEYPEGIDTAEYYDYYKPAQVTSYTSQESFIHTMHTQQTGPWLEGDFQELYGDKS